MGAVTVMVPVGVAQVGCAVTDAVGTAGALGTAATLILAVGADTHVVDAASLAVTVWLPGLSRANDVPAWYVPPSMAYS